MHEINMITLSTLLYADKDDYRVRTSYFLFILFPFNFYRPSITMIALRPSLKYLIAFHALNQENKTKLKCCNVQFVGQMFLFGMFVRSNSYISNQKICHH